MDRREVEARYGSDVVIMYGLADLIAEEYDTSDVFESAQNRIDDLLGHVRVFVEPQDYDPDATDVAQKVRDVTGKKGEQVVGNGYHIRTHVINTDLNGHYGMLKRLPIKNKKGKMLQRYYPHITKMSLGNKSAKNVKMKPEALALALIATLTYNKVARRCNANDSMALFPAMPLDALVKYIQVLKTMQPEGPGLRWHITSSSGKVRLDEHNGNFPEAPPEWAFGTIGLTAAIASWNEQAGYEEAYHVIHKLANSRLYALGESDPELYPEAPHLADIARDVASVLPSIWKVVSDWHENERNEFYRLFREWLLYFDRASWTHFLSIRAEYPHEFESLIATYLMDYENVDSEIVRSARIAGQHINTECYFSAVDDTSTREKAREEKTKRIASFESLIQDARTPSDLVSRVSVQAGRLRGRDFPGEASLFFESLLTGDVGLQDGKNMLRAFARVRGVKKRSSKAPDSSDTAPPDEMMA